jgi:hypothetical protein
VTSILPSVLATRPSLTSREARDGVVAATIAGSTLARAAGRATLIKSPIYAWPAMVATLLPCTYCCAPLLVQLCHLWKWRYDSHIRTAPLHHILPVSPNAPMHV